MRLCICALFFLRLRLVVVETNKAKDPPPSPPSAPCRPTIEQAVAKAVGLPNWDLAASPCLRSRLAPFVPAHERNLKIVELCEEKIRLVLKDELRRSDALRVRIIETPDMDWHNSGRHATSGWVCVSSVLFLLGFSLSSSPSLTANTLFFFFWYVSVYARICRCPSTTAAAAAAGGSPTREPKHQYTLRIEVSSEAAASTLEKYNVEHLLRPVFIATLGEDTTQWVCVRPKQHDASIYDEYVRMFACLADDDTVSLDVVIRQYQYGSNAIVGSPQATRLGDKGASKAA